MKYHKLELARLVPELLGEKKYPELRELFKENNMDDLADIFQKLPLSEAIIVYRLLPLDLSSELFTYLEPQFQIQLVDSFTISRIRAIFAYMDSDEIVDFLEEMPADVVKKLLQSASESTRDEINQLLNYQKNSAGAKMSIEFVEFHPQDSVAKAIEKLRENYETNEDLNSYFVVDEQRHYLGMVKLRDLVVSSNDLPVSKLMEYNDVFARTNEDQETAAKKIADYDLEAIAVVDAQKRLVGALTIDNALDVVMEEAEEDLQHLSGLSPIEESYLRASVSNIFKSRIFWLSFLMVSDSFTGYIIQNYEDKLSLLPVLASSIPIIMSSAGNSGSQSSVMIIRAIAVDRLGFGDILYILRKEFLVSLLTGSVVGTLNFIRVVFFSGRDAKVAIVISLTIFISIIISDLIGAILPLIATAIKQDPASMSTPLITTIIDAVSLMIYFFLVVLILKI